MFSLVCLSSWFDGLFASVLPDIDWCFRKVGGAFVAFAYFGCHIGIFSHQHIYLFASSIHQYRTSYVSGLIWPHQVHVKRNTSPRKVICTPRDPNRNLRALSGHTHTLVCIVSVGKSGLKWTSGESRKKRQWTLLYYNYIKKSLFVTQTTCSLPSMDVN